MSVVRVAAAADLHCRVDSPGRIKRLLGPAASEADVLVIAGDLTDHGLVEEAEVLAEDLSTIRLPKVAVLGNHDHEADKPAEVTRILEHAGVHILQGDTWIFEKRLGFAGVKGFGGGFGDATLQPWGEEIVKRFVYEAVNEALKLEMALAKLEVLGVGTRVALCHYAPVHATVVGEKPEIIPFLGCSRLAETVDKQHVALVFHGHAHHGTLRGETDKGIPVYNVAMPLLRTELDRRYALLEIEAPAAGEHPWPAKSPHPS